MYRVDVKLHIYINNLFVHPDTCFKSNTPYLDWTNSGFGEVNITDKSDNRDINYCMTPKHQTIQIVLFKSKTNTWIKQGSLT